MGTCLIEQRTVVIEPHLHFLAQNAELTCVATPIVDPRGLVLGALDISCYRMMEREPFVTLLNETARDIEDRLLQVESRQYFRVAFGHRRQYLGTVLEGILLADPQGCIVGANRAAVQLLGQSLRRDVCGRKIEDLLGLPLRKFGEARETDGSKRASVSSGARASFCVRMQPPRSAPEQRPDVQSSSVRAAVESAERDAVSAALREWNWNISRTARALGIGRKTLYRKIQRHQLQ
jgi:transcriptional regulator of acetoin/glycerol metabolism